LLIVLLVIAALVAGSPAPAAQGASAPATATVTATASATPSPSSLPVTGSPERRMYDALNAERVRQGMAPVAWSYELGSAAAQHSADMAAHGYFDHYGSDGSNQQQRAARAGYIVPPGSGWMVIEAVSGGATVEGALGSLLSDGVHRGVLLRQVWREVGVGYVAGSGAMSYWTLDFGCRPNRLPVFADPSADGQSLALTFTNEECAAYGGGPDQMGRATDLMVSAYDDFRDGGWQSFVASKQIARPAGSELNVRLRDASGRLSAPLRLGLDGLGSAGASTTATLTPTPPATRTSTPIATATPTATPSPTATATARASSTPTPVPAEQAEP
jgi:uncharacterized protein YkwD